MGYRIESYTFDELQRVALPGTAATALFWAIPLGNWPEGALHNLWNTFYFGHGVCRELGLLLVRKKPGKDNTPRNHYLSDLVASGNLADLVPKGALLHAAFVPNKGARGLLICSGAYPQPGWGLWMEINNMHHADSLDQYFEDILNEIPMLDRNSKGQLRNAADDWARLESIKKAHHLDQCRLDTWI